jgi:hypothetical protein
VSATFKITSGPAAFNGDLVGNATFLSGSGGPPRSESTAEKVRNVSPIKINEFRNSAGSPTNQTDAFIELFNAGADAVDISNWTLTQHQTQQAVFSTVKIPAGLGWQLAASICSVFPRRGSSFPRGAGRYRDPRPDHGRDMKVGDTISIDTGSNVESRKVASIGTAARRQ